MLHPQALRLATFSHNLRGHGLQLVGNWIHRCGLKSLIISVEGVLVVAAWISWIWSLDVHV